MAQDGDISKILIGTTQMRADPVETTRKDLNLYRKCSNRKSRTTKQRSETGVFSGKSDSVERMLQIISGGEEDAKTR